MTIEEESIVAGENEGSRLNSEKDGQSIWAVWVREPLTRDADTLLRWSKTSFYAGCPKPALMLFNEKEFSLFMKSGNYEFVIERMNYARLYYGEVRLTKDGLVIDLSTGNQETQKPPDDLLGLGSSLCGGSC
jgi:hypothetical protein